MTEGSSHTPPSTVAGSSFRTLWAEIDSTGRSTTSGGYNRLTGSTADLALREWFVGAAQARGMTVELDRVGNQWAWLGDPTTSVGSAQPLVLGSHLDSVIEGGAYDGALGVVSSFAAVDDMVASGTLPRVPVAVVNFIEEEGARFGVTCLGSRLLTGDYDHAAALSLRDDDGNTFAEVLTSMGVDVEHLGRDATALSRIGTYVELHVEQGRGLIDLDRSVAVGTAIRPHGRWRIELEGRGDHAGTAVMTERDDPMLTFAEVISVARSSGVANGCFATVGRAFIHPNVGNAVPSKVTAWLDARGSDELRVQSVVRDVGIAAGGSLVEEAFTTREAFDDKLAASLSRTLRNAPLLESGAGHDAGILATAGVRTAMLYVRNPTGVSHAPEEFAEESDCISGVHALVTAAQEITSTDALSEA